jgi:hypothetical protein
LLHFRGRYTKKIKDKFETKIYRNNLTELKEYGYSFSSAQTLSPTAIIIKYGTLLQAPTLFPLWGTPLFSRRENRQGQEGLGDGPKRAWPQAAIKEYIHIK